ncbi:hypothetical protein PMAYCL1PPCAC_14134, partial [Pristionchus mayeri]
DDVMEIAGPSTATTAADAASTQPVTLQAALAANFNADSLAVAAAYGSHSTKSFSERKPFECNLCRKRFVTQGRMEKHRETHKIPKIRHTVFPSYSMRDAGYAPRVKSADAESARALTVKRKPALPREEQQNLLQQLQQPTAARVACEECGQYFKDKLARAQHVIVQHKDKVNLKKSKKAKMHACGYCEKTFA